MGEKVTIPVEFDVEDVRRCQSKGMCWPLGDYERKARDHVNTNAEGRVVFAAKAAVLRFELPWEPSEQDVTDYIDAFYGRSTSMVTRRRAAEAIKAHRRNGWDSVPRRIEGTVNDG